MAEKLALFGGSRAVQYDPGDMFIWPIITKEDEDAVLEVLHRRAMSGTDITKQFEQKICQMARYRICFGF